MTGNDRERDVEALAEALASAGIADAARIWAEHAEGCLGDCSAHGCPVQRQEWIAVEGVAHAVLSSDWLAAHDQAIADEAAAEALAGHRCQVGGDGWSAARGRGSVGGDQ